MDPKTTAASAILRRFAVALKTYALYPPPSPVTDRAVGELLDGLHHYIEANGPFNVRVSRGSFHVNEATFKDATSASLAFQLYKRKVIGFSFVPGVSAQDLLVFLTILRQDRASTEAAGDVPEQLHQAGVQTIKVMEIVLSHGAAHLDQTWDALGHLLEDGRSLPPEHRQIVVDILRSGPAAIGALFAELQTMLAGAVEDTHPDLQQTTYEVIKNLDRIILDQPMEDQQQFYNNLAAAILLLEDPVRIPLEHTLAAHERTGETARALVDHLSAQRLVKVVPRSSLEETAVAEGSLAAEPPEDQAAPDPEIQILHAQQAGATGPPAFVIHRAAHDEPPEALAETPTIDDVSLTREVIGTLVEVLCNLEGEADIAATARCLEEYLPWLFEHQEFSLMRTVLHELKDAAAGTSAQEKAAADLADGLVKDHLLHRLIDTLWNSRGTKIEEDIRACLVLLADRVVFPLMKIVGEEPRIGPRRMLCDVIVAIGHDRVDDIGSFVSDARWYLVRNVAYVLGRLGNPRGVAYVARLTEHDEYRVRSEAAAALALIGGSDAEVQLVRFLDDPDDRVRLKTIVSLSDAGVALALRRLLRLLERPDRLNRHFAIKQEVIAVLARARVHEALPVLLRLSRRRFVLGQHSRTLRRLAQEAVATIRAGVPVREPSGLDVSAVGAT